MFVPGACCGCTGVEEKNPQEVVCVTADLASPVRAYRPHFLGPEDTEDPIPSPERSPKRLPEALSHLLRRGNAT